jgi:hypothetical protein
MRHFGVVRLEAKAASGEVERELAIVRRMLNLEILDCKLPHRIFVPMPRGNEPAFRFL